MREGEGYQATATGREDASGQQGARQSYWRGDMLGVSSPMYGQPGYGESGYGNPGYSMPPSGSQGAPYYGQSTPQGYQAPYYDTSVQDDVDFLTRQSDASRAVYSKDHIAAGLLAIFLGSFGVHKFYLGYNQAGFIMLAVTVIGGIVSFGLASLVVGVIALIEGVIYLAKSQSEFDQTYVLQKRDWF